MRIFLTGATGVLGRALTPALAAAGHEVVAPGHRDLDLFEPSAVARAVEGSGAVYHLATRIPSPEAQVRPGAWEENDRLRSILEAECQARTERHLQRGLRRRASLERPIQGGDQLATRVLRGRPRRAGPSRR